MWENPRISSTALGGAVGTWFSATTGGRLCVMVRKSIKRGAKQADVPQSPVINLLVVTARPNEEQDVGYRTISRPLIEAIENSQLAVNVELLRPGTYEALARHLEEKGAGFYHIIHFDAHGALMKYQEIQNEERQSPMLIR
ncbi:hypothetical protein [Scytonema sp. PRP1]|uniref:hypothetical protein n=1 Tax=Scytonema sp. PRP1 TaxID=3120513 RepID=UPI002FD0ED11